LFPILRLTVLPFCKSLTFVCGGLAVVLPGREFCWVTFFYSNGEDRVRLGLQRTGCPRLDWAISTLPLFGVRTISWGTHFRKSPGKAVLGVPIILLVFVCCLIVGCGIGVVQSRPQAQPFGAVCRCRRNRGAVFKPDIQRATSLGFGGFEGLCLVDAFFALAGWVPAWALIDGDRAFSKDLG